MSITTTTGTGSTRNQSSECFTIHTFIIVLNILSLMNPGLHVTDPNLCHGIKAAWKEMASLAAFSFLSYKSLPSTVRSSPASPVGISLLSSSTSRQAPVSHRGPYMFYPIGLLSMETKGIRHSAPAVCHALINRRVRVQLLIVIFAKTTKHHSRKQTNNNNKT